MNLFYSPVFHIPVIAIPTPKSGKLYPNYPFILKI